MQKAKETITSALTKTSIYLDESLSPISGKPWSELKLHPNSFHNDSSSFTKGVKKTIKETMPMRTWSIHTHDHNNNELTYEDYTGLWYEKRYHPVVGLIYYKDSSGNHMRTDLNKEGSQVINYADSKGRLLVHDEPSSMILFTPVTKTFKCKLDESKERTLGELVDWLSTFQSLKVKLPASLSVRKFAQTKGMM